jgi:thiosulfate reductase cytochrome b subunit
MFFKATYLAVVLVLLPLVVATGQRCHRALTRRCLGLAAIWGSPIRTTFHFVAAWLMCCSLLPRWR